MLCIALGDDSPQEQIGSAIIRFVPFERDPTIVARYYQAADVYLHAARADTFPNAVLEALACGTPVVATAVGGIPEQIKNERTGIIVAPGDADAMANATVRLLQDKSICVHFSENAAHDAKVRFDVDRQRDDYLDWYRDILARDVSTTRAFRQQRHFSNAVRAALPKISIVTTSFNHGDFLEETIQSVLSQNYPNLEYIIVDGGSTDQSVEIIRKYESQLAWWVSEKDRGQSHALNKGFARATGEIFAFINSDDFYEPIALLRIADAFRNGAQWVAGQVRYQRGDVNWPLPPYPAKSRADWLLFCPIPQPGCFWSAKLSHRLGPFREDLNFTMDYEFWLRLRFDSLLPKIIDEPIAVYRLHDASKTIAQNQRFADEARQLRGEYVSRLNMSERIRFWLARQHRRARRQALRGRDSVRNGKLLHGARDLAAAYLRWPLLAGDPRGLKGVRKILQRSTQPGTRASPRPDPPLPFSWSDPDD